MESLNMDAGLSLNSSGHSTFALAEKENQIEQMRRKVRVLESDNAELRTTLPRLKDAQGKDCTGEMIKMNKELLLAKEQCERWRTDYIELTKKYDMFEKSTITQLDQKDKQMTQLRHQAMEMEEENGKLREKLENEKSRVWHLQRGEFEDQLATPKAVQNEGADDQLSTPKAHNQMLASIMSKIPQNVDVVDETYLCNVDDAEQLAAHLLMILETLDKNYHNANELQNDIFTFLASHSICSNNPEKFALLNSVYKKVTDNRLAQIRAGNEQFRSNMSVGDKDFDACMKHLAVHDSITLSSIPSFAGFSKEIAFQLETSTPEMDNDQNLTSGSFFAGNVTCRTSTLLEVCVRMFEKLRGTVEFFQNLLKMLGVSAEELGEDIAKKLEAMKLDLDVSVGEAQSMLSEGGGLAAIEDSFAQCRVEREQQINDMKVEIETMRKSQQDVEQKQLKLEQSLAEERDQMLKVTAERDAFARELRDRETEVERLNSEMKELQKQLEELDGMKQMLQAEVDKMTNSELKEKVLVHSREELVKILDTMECAKSSCNSVVSSLRKKKPKIGKKQPTQDTQKQ
ncbi:hypothetical protein niasHT_030745 [Heterodera trifolii]|uniref:Uncharacterized protein n=1 Tax=Heterodera trifolii TaxID=157864 RepID=A0ABD2HNX2_9BILA